MNTRQRMKARGYRLTQPHLASIYVKARYYGIFIKRPHPLHRIKLYNMPLKYGLYLDTDSV